MGNTAEWGRGDERWIVEDRLDKSVHLYSTRSLHSTAYFPPLHAQFVAAHLMSYQQAGRHER